MSETTLTRPATRIEGLDGPAVREALARVVTEQPDGDVVVDLGAGASFDVPVIEALTAIAAPLVARGDGLVLVGTPEVLQRALRLGLGDLFSVQRG